jgi:hypothetical protein
MSLVPSESLLQARAENEAYRRSNLDRPLPSQEALLDMPPGAHASEVSEATRSRIIKSGREFGPYDGYDAHEAASLALRVRVVQHARKLTDALAVASARLNGTGEYDPDTRNLVYAAFARYTESAEFFSRVPIDPPSLLAAHMQRLPVASRERVVEHARELTDALAVASAQLYRTRKYDPDTQNRVYAAFAQYTQGAEFFSRAPIDPPSLLAAHMRPPPLPIR